RDPKSFTFNADAIRVASDRQMLYNDKRANTKGKVPDDVWTLCRHCARVNSLAGNDASTDQWLMSRVCGTFKERVQWHPCQMPEEVLERIVLASSNPGDLVFDPFSGSGTTLSVANRLGRHWLGTDISPDYVRNANERITAVAPGNKPKSPEADGGLFR
ncbi:MAG: site-specific DNA-methyltransferase, partial [Phycisphaerae bacterium]|nr:site-specific DNA-methyltransferase [Phycisphaerae bacterium]